MAKSLARNEHFSRVSEGKDGVAIEHSFLHWIDHYGYWGLFGMLMLGIVGLPLPDETILTGLGWYISTTHRLDYIPAILSAFLGSAAGITLSFLIGALGGRVLLVRYGKYIHLSEERLTKIEAIIEKYGRLALFFGYFVPGLRHFTAIVAGLGQMKYRFFWLPAYTGAFVWVITFLALGKFLGGTIHKFGLHHIAHILKPYSLLIALFAIVLFLLIAAYRIWIWRKKQNKNHVVAKEEET